MQAHPLVDEGRRAYLEADFDGALEALNEAAQAGELDRSELVELLFTRALVAFALADESALERDLRMLAELDANLEPGADIPPAVREAFVRVAAEAQRPVRLSVSVERLPGALRLRAEPEPPDSPLVQSIELRARTAGGTWRAAEAGELTLPVEQAVRVEYHATAIGPGDVPVARVGEATRPERLSMGAPSTSAVLRDPGGARADATSVPLGSGMETSAGPGGASDSGGRGRAWLWGSVAGVLLVAAAAGLAVGLRSDGGGTRVDVPMLEARDR